MVRLSWGTTNRLRYLGFLAFGALLWYVGPENLIPALAGTNLSYLFVALVFNLPLIALKTLRWQVFLGEAKTTLPFCTAYRAYAAGIFIGCLTPGRLGEFIKAAYVSQNSGEELGRTLPSVFIDRLFDLDFLLVLGVIGLFQYSLASPQTGLFPIMLLTAVLLGLPAILRIQRLGNWLRTNLVRGKLRESWREAILEIHGQLAGLSPAVLARGFGLTFLAYLIFFFQCQLGASATGIEIPFVDLVLIMSVINLLTFLPVSISGIGVRDASLIILLARYGVSQAQAVVFSLAILFIFYLGGMLLGSICWVWKPVKIETVRPGKVLDSEDKE
jgi:uncharacterized protein (TIRG00374 family)